MAKKPPKGLPPWMATFADMCTLLLTFFVLLLTFANMDVVKFKEMLGSVRDAFGVQVQSPGEYQPTKPKEAPSKTAPQPMSPRQPAMPAFTQFDPREAAEADRMANQVRKMAEESGLGGSLNISSGPQGVRLRVKGQLLFQPGQAALMHQANQLLDSLVKVMNKFDFYLTVEGHTDDQPISTAHFPSNWELSAARAAAVLRALVNRGVPRQRIAAVGYADNYPLASNSTEQGRNKNRRVEFVFTKRPLRAGMQ